MASQKVRHCRPLLAQISETMSIGEHQRFAKRLGLFVAGDTSRRRSTRAADFRLLACSFLHVPLGV